MSDWRTRVIHDTTIHPLPVRPREANAEWIGEFVGTDARYVFQQEVDGDVTVIQFLSGIPDDMPGHPAMTIAARDVRRFLGILRQVEQPMIVAEPDGMGERGA